MSLMDGYSSSFVYSIKSSQWLYMLSRYLRTLSHLMMEETTYTIIHNIVSTKALPAATNVRTMFEMHFSSSNGLALIMVTNDCTSNNVIKMIQEEICLLKQSRILIIDLPPIIITCGSSSIQ